MSLPVVAYIDVGIGSLFVQLLLGGVAGLMAFARLRWKSLRQRTTPHEPSSIAGLQPSDRES